MNNKTSPELMKALKILGEQPAPQKANDHGFRVLFDRIMTAISMHPGEADSWFTLKLRFRRCGDGSVDFTDPEMVVDNDGGAAHV